MRGRHSSAARACRSGSGIVGPASSRSRPALTPSPCSDRRLAAPTAAGDLARPILEAMVMISEGEVPVHRATRAIRFRVFAMFASALIAGVPKGAPAQRPTPERPLGTLREQAALQQSWLGQRIEQVLPALMRKHGVDMWVVPMREYAEDPVFTSLVSPTTFAARRRTIYVFHDQCASRGAPAAPSTGCRVERLAPGGTSQGGVYEAISSERPPDGPAGGQARRQAELWGDEQWNVLRRMIEARDPRVIAINT